MLEGENVDALLHVEPRPLLIHTAFPLPLLATLELDAAVYSTELKRHSGTGSSTLASFLQKKKQL